MGATVPRTVAPPVVRNEVNARLMANSNEKAAKGSRHSSDRTSYDLSSLRTFAADGARPSFFKRAKYRLKRITRCCVIPCRRLMKVSEDDSSEADDIPWEGYSSNSSLVPRPDVSIANSPGSAEVQPGLQNSRANAWASREESPQIFHTATFQEVVAAEPEEQFFDAEESRPILTVAVPRRNIPRQTVVTRQPQETLVIVLISLIMLLTEIAFQKLGGTA